MRALPRTQPATGNSLRVSISPTTLFTHSASTARPSAQFEKPLGGSKQHRSRPPLGRTHRLKFEPCVHLGTPRGFRYVRTAPRSVRIPGVRPDLEMRNSGRAGKEGPGEERRWQTLPPGHRIMGRWCNTSRENHEHQRKPGRNVPGAVVVRRSAAWLARISKQGVCDFSKRSTRRCTSGQCSDEGRRESDGRRPAGIRARAIARYLKIHSSGLWGVRGIYSDPRHGRAILAGVVAEVRATDGLCRIQRDRKR